jgi:paraquat-inducible protein A
VYRYDLISCHDCGVLHQKRPIGPHERARCTRCEAVLYRGLAGGDGSLPERSHLSPADARVVNKVAAVVLGSILTFLIAQFFPIVKAEFNGVMTSSTLIGAIGVLWSENMEIVASVVFLFSIVFPLAELGALLHVTLGLRCGMRVRGFHKLLRLIHALREWGMTEVLMLGILVTLVKLVSSARIYPQPALYAFAALTLLLTVVSHFDPRTLWDIGDRLRGPRPGSDDAVRTAVAAGRPVACGACGLVHLAGAGRHQRCRRCGAGLHRRIPGSVARTWALLAAAALMYIPAHLLPVTYSRTIISSQDDTIITGVMYFWANGSKALAVLIFTASIVVPVLKLVVLALLTWTSQRRSRWRPMQRTKLYRLVEFVGRWSMLDIFVITLSVSLVRFNSLAVIIAGPGAFAFCAVVVLTMLATLQFDPRLIWDPVTPIGEEHA